MFLLNDNIGHISTLATADSKVQITDSILALADAGPISALKWSKVGIALEICWTDEWNGAKGML